MINLMIIMMTMMMMIIIIYYKTDSSEAINRQRPTKSQQQRLTKEKHDQKNGHLYMANRFTIIYLHVQKNDRTDLISQTDSVFFPSCYSLLISSHAYKRAIIKTQTSQQKPHEKQGPRLIVIQSLD